MHTYAKTLLLACILSAAPLPLARPATACAAEFDIDSGRVVLRRLQFCGDCGSALLVTDVGAGERIRCPDCGREQARLEDEFLLTQLYQICKLCSGPLNPEGHRPGDVVECSVCQARQPLVADAFAKGDRADGAGYRPGFPPGTGKKTLLLSPNRPDAAITAVPLDGEGEAGDSVSGAAAGNSALAARAVPEPPLPDGPALAGIPAPPPGFARGRPAESPAPPLPDIAPAESSATAAGRQPQAAQACAPSGAIDVPAVTADLFGGPRRAAPDESSFVSAGDVLARVDGQPIHARDVDLFVRPVMERLRQQAGSADAPALAQREAELRREVLARLIDRELTVREAAALGHRPAPNAVRAREAELAQLLAGSGIDLRGEAERDIIMADMRARFGERFAAVTPNAVREFYRQHREEMQQPRLLALDRLVVYEDRSGRADRRPARDIALEIASRLEQGAPFDTLRERYDEFLPAAALAHTPPALKPEDAYSRQVLAAAGDLRTGAIFGPVAMSGMLLFGKVADLRPAGPVPFAEAEKSIRTRLETQATDNAFATWLAGLRTRAEIEVMQ